MHHKLLLGSTALVGAGLLLANGAAAQDAEDFVVTLGGYTEFLVEGATEESLTNGDGDRGYFFNHDTEIHVRAEGTANGVTYGSLVELEAGALPMEADEMNLYFSGAFGRIELGRQDGPVDSMVQDATIIGRGTAGVDGDTDNQTTAGNIIDVGDATKATYYTPRIAGFQLGASFTPDSGDGVSAPLTGDENGDRENAIQGGANWTGALGGLDLGLHAIGTLADNEDPVGGDVKAWGFGGLTEFAGLGFAASYGHSDFDNGNEVDFVLLGVAYEFGPVGVGFHYEHDWVDGDPFFFSGDDLDDINIYVLSADVGILPGVVVKGDVSYNDSDPGAEDPGDESWAGVLAVQLNY